MANTVKLEKWMYDAAEIMVREAKSLAQAVTDLGISISTVECKKVALRPSFQRLLWEARNSWNKEVADLPNRTKQSTIGQLQILAQKLIEESQYDKAAEVLFKLAKLENWVGEAGTVNVFGSLTQKDIDELKKKIPKETSAEVVQ